jgi:hypothetical protein
MRRCHKSHAVVHPPGIRNHALHGRTHIQYGCRAIPARIRGGPSFGDRTNINVTCAKKNTAFGDSTHKTSTDNLIEILRIIMRMPLHVKKSDMHSDVPSHTRFLFASLFEPRDNTISVRHPLFKQLGPICIAITQIHITDGLNRFQRLDPRPVSVCVLFQRKRCTAGILCNQIHVKRKHMEEIHKAIEYIYYHNLVSIDIFTERLQITGQSKRSKPPTSDRDKHKTPLHAQPTNFDEVVTPWTMIGQFGNLLHGLGLA